MASEKMPNRSRIGSVGPENPTFKVAARPKSGPAPQRPGQELQVWELLYRIFDSSYRYQSSHAQIGGRFGAGPLLGRAATSNVRFSGPTESILDRLDIFSDSIDLKNTLALLFLPHLLSQRRSRKKHIFLQTYVISLHEFRESPLHTNSLHLPGLHCGFT